MSPVVVFYFYCWLHVQTRWRVIRCFSFSRKPSTNLLPLECMWSSFIYIDTLLIDILNDCFINWYFNEYSKRTNLNRLMPYCQLGYDVIVLWGYFTNWIYCTEIKPWIRIDSFLLSLFEILKPDVNCGYGVVVFVDIGINNSDIMISVP